MNKHKVQPLRKYKTGQGMVGLIVSVILASAVLIIVANLLQSQSKKSRSMEDKAKVDSHHFLSVQGSLNDPATQTTLSAEVLTNPNLKDCLKDLGTNCATTFHNAPPTSVSDSVDFFSNKAKCPGLGGECNIEVKRSYAWNCPSPSQCNGLKVKVKVNTRYTGQVSHIAEKETSVIIPARFLVGQIAKSDALPCQNKRVTGINETTLELSCAGVDATTSPVLILSAQIFDPSVFSLYPGLAVNTVGNSTAAVQQIPQPLAFNDGIKSTTNYSLAETTIPESLLPATKFMIDATCAGVGATCQGSAYGGSTVCNFEGAQILEGRECCFGRNKIIDIRDVPGNLARQEVTCGTSCPSRKAYAGTVSERRCCSGRASFKNGRYLKRCSGGRGGHCTFCGSRGGCNFSSFEYTCD